MTVSMSVYIFLYSKPPKLQKLQKLHKNYDMHAHAQITRTIEKRRRRSSAFRVGLMAVPDLSRPIHHTTQHNVKRKSPIGVKIWIIVVRLPMHTRHSNVRVWSPRLRHAETPK